MVPSISGIAADGPVEMFGWFSRMTESVSQELELLGQNRPKNLTSNRHTTG
jgi:hypothetical protein